MVGVRKPVSLFCSTPVDLIAFVGLEFNTAMEESADLCDGYPRTDVLCGGTPMLEAYEVTEFNIPLKLVGVLLFFNAFDASMLLDDVGDVTALNLVFVPAIEV